MTHQAQPQPSPGIPPAHRRFHLLVTALMFVLIWQLISLLGADGMGGLDLVILLAVLHTLAVPAWPRILLEWQRLEQFLIRHREGIERDRSAASHQRRAFIRSGARGRRIVLGIWFVRILIFGLLAQSLFSERVEFDDQVLFMLLWLISTRINDWRLRNALLGL